MTGYVMAMGSCACCKKVFSFNPHFVPSTRALSQGTGPREPVCLECMEAANVMRAEHKLPPLAIHPEAYQPLPEGEL